MSYLDQLRQSPNSRNPNSGNGSPQPSPSNYLEQLRQPKPATKPHGHTQFARAYASLLPRRHLFSSIGQATGKSRRLFYGGREIDISVLVELTEACAEDGVLVSVSVIQKVAEALACPAADPYEERLRTWLANAADAALLSPTGCGDLARITLNAVPHWFVSMRDVKAELDAYGAANVRRVRAAMKPLGWRERRAIAWGRRRLGFVRPVQTTNM